MGKNRWSAFFIFCVILSLENLTGRLLAANSEGDSVTIKKCQDFKITGNGTSAAWNRTGWINLIQQEPKAAPYQTKVKVLYSDKGIYFLFNCEDKKLSSTMKADNMNLWEEDVVEIFFGPMKTSLFISSMNFLPLILNCRSWCQIIRAT